MTRFKMLAICVCAFALGSAAVAADAVKVTLKDFKWKAAFEGGTDLGGYDENEARFFFYTNGTATGDVAIPEDGEYTITVEASCSEAQKELAKFKVSVGETVVTKEHACTEENKKKYTFTAKLKKGKQPLVVAFLNDKFKEGEYDLNLFVYAVTVEKK
jgi:opacity protein-like surface antigen